MSYPETGNLKLLRNTVLYPLDKICISKIFSKLSNHYENFKSQSDIFSTRISCPWFPSVHCSLAQSQQSDRFIVCLLLYFSGRGGGKCSVVMQTRAGARHGVRQLSWLVTQDAVSSHSSRHTSQLHSVATSPPSQQEECCGCQQFDVLASSGFQRYQLSTINKLAVQCSVVQTRQ